MQLSVSGTEEEEFVIGSVDVWADVSEEVVVGPESGFEEGQIVVVALGVFVEMLVSVDVGSFSCS